MTDIARVGIEVDSSDLRTANTEVNKLTSSTKQAGHQSAALGAQAKKSSTGLKQQAMAAKAVGHQSRFAGAHVGNLTAQFNDIGVMMAAGQSPFLLAVQQGTQVTQVLQNMGREVGPVRALFLAFKNFISPVQFMTIGLIAGGAALGQWAIKAATAGKKTLDFEKHLEELTEEVSNFRTATDDALVSMDDLADKYGSVHESMIPVLDSIREYNELMANIKAQDFANTFAKEMGEGVLARINPFAKMAHDIFEVDPGDVRLQSLRALNKQLGVTESAEQRIALLQQMKRETISLAREVEGINLDEAEIVNQLDQQLLLNGMIVRSKEKQSREANKISKEEKDRLKELEDEAKAMLASLKMRAELGRKTIIQEDKIATAHKEATAALQGKIRINEVAVIHGEKSNELLEIENELERENLRIKLQKQGFSEEEIEAQLKLTKSLQTSAKIRKDAAAAAKIAEKEAQERLRKIEGFVEGITDTWAEWLVRGQRDFAGFVDQIKRMFQNLLIQMISTAAKNRIMIGLGLAGAGSAAGAAGAAVGSAASSGVGSFAGSLFGRGASGIISGGISNFALGLPITGFGGGLGNTLLSGFGAGGSLFSMFSPATIGANAALAGGGIMATVGAALPAIGAVLGAASLISKAFGGGRKYWMSSGAYKDVHQSITELTGNLSLPEYFTRGQLRRGSDARFIRNQFLTDDAGNQAQHDELRRLATIFKERIIGETMDSAEMLAEAQGKLNARFEELGVAIPKTREDFKNLVQDIDLVAGSYKSGERRAAQKLYTDLLKLTEAFDAVMTATEQLEAQQKQLEAVLKMVGITIGQVSGQSITQDSAEALVNRFGGIDNLGSALSVYQQNFFSAQERVEMARKNLSQQLGTLPHSTRDYRKLVEAQDLNTEAGREMYATLIELAPQYAQVAQFERQLAEERRRAAEALRQQIEAMKKHQRQLRHNSEFFTTREIMSNLREDLGKFASFSREEFRDLMLGIDLTSSSGRKLYTTLSDIMPQFLQLRNLEEQIAEERRQAAAALREEIAALQQQQKQLRHNSQFFSRGEIISNLRQDLGDYAEFSKREFRDQLLSLDVTTESGRRLFKTLTEIAPQFLQLQSLEEQLADERRRAAEALRQEIEQLKEQQRLFQFNEQLFSRDEIIENLRNDLGERADLSKEQLRDQILGLNLNTKAGRKLYETLTDLLPQFLQLRNLEEQIAEERRRAAEALKQEIKALQEQQTAFRYSSEFFSRDEIIENLRNDLGERAGLSKDQFRDQILGLDLTTKAGRELYKTLIDVMPQLLQLRNLEEQIAEERRQAAEALKQEIEQLQNQQRLLQFNEGLFERDEIIENLREDLAERADLTKQQLREQLLGLDLTTEAGRDLYRTLTDLLPQFLQLRNLEEQIAEERRQAAEALRQEIEALKDQRTQFGFNEQFYLPTEVEANIQRHLLDTFMELNRSMPSTREEFRALVESADLTTESGRELFKTLMEVANLFVEVTDGVRDLNQELAGAQGLFTTYAKEVFAAQAPAQPGISLSSADPGVQSLIQAINDGNIRMIRELVDLRLETARSSYQPTTETVDLGS